MLCGVGLGSRFIAAASLSPRKLTVKALLVCYIVNKQDSHGASVVGCGDGAEALLARGIPDLELDGAVGQVAFLGQEGGADGGFFVGLEVVVDEAED